MDLRDQAKSFTNEYLLEQLCFKADEYTSEARGILESEAKQRGITDEDVAQFIQERQEVEYASEDFVKLEHLFSQTDALLASAMLRERHIPFFVTGGTSSDILPTETVAMRLFSVHVHKEFLEPSQRILDEQFTQSEGIYQQKPLSSADQLRSLSFYETRIPDDIIDQPLDVDFSDKEKQAILELADRVAQEQEQIEQRIERPLFYFENVEDLIESLKGRRSFTVVELMTLLEVLQVYCDQPEFPEFLMETGAALLEFLQSITKR